MTERSELEIGLLYYAVNPYIDDLHRHLAQRLLQGACEKAGGFKLNKHVAGHRVRQTKPPPSIPVNVAKRDTARRAINSFGQRRFVYASRYRSNVENQIEEWVLEHEAPEAPPIKPAQRKSGAKG